MGNYGLVNVNKIVK